VLAARTTVLGHSKGAYASTRIRRYGHTPAEPTKRLPRVQFLFSLMSRISGRFGHSVGPPLVWCRDPQPTGPTKLTIADRRSVAAVGMKRPAAVVPLC